MQINGVNEFFARIASLTKPAAGVQNSPLSSILSPLQMFKTDTMILSDMGKKLSFGVDKAPLLNENREADVTDPILKATEKYIKKAETVLARMHELTTAAQDEKLSSLDRINMQIEMEELRDRLQDIAFDYAAKLPGGPTHTEVKRKTEETFKHLAEKEFYAMKSDDSSLLERARERIIRGENWNVREAFAGIVKSELKEELITTSNGLSHTVLYDPKDGQGRWVVVDDNVLNAELIPTTRELLERDNAIILMDAKSAAEGATRVEGEIESLQKLREQYTQAVDSYHQAKETGNVFDAKKVIGTTARIALEIIAYGDIVNEATITQGRLTRTSSIEPTWAEYFYYDANEDYGIPARIVHRDDRERRAESVKVKPMDLNAEANRPKPPINDLPVGQRLNLVA